MSKVTYQTRLSDSVQDFCNALGSLFAQIERDLYKDLSRGEKLNDLKKSYQVKYQINARQFNSIHLILKGKIASRKECYQRQIKELEIKIKSLIKEIKQLEKKIKNLAPVCSLNSQKTEKNKLKFSLHQKKRKLKSCQDKLTNLKKNKPSFIFGGKKFWYAQYNLAENGYSSHEEWLTDWQNYRSSQFTLIGSKDETQGNQNCQLLANNTNTLKIRVPKCYESVFGKYYLIENVVFNYGQKEIEYALKNKQALTFRFVKKANFPNSADAANGRVLRPWQHQEEVSSEYQGNQAEEKWYVFCSLELPEVPYQTNYKNGMIGIDLNPSVIGWSYSDSEGNLKASCQIKFNIQDKNKNQTQAIIGDIVKELVNLASYYKCPIAVENLDFSNKKITMKEQGIRYSRMLSNFAYSSFLKMLISRAEKWGVEVRLVNPAYSSLIGLTKFMAMYGLSSDTAAALVLARRALRKSERIPPSYARLVQVDSSRHVWSLWNALSKKLKGRKRHSFFSVANSEVEVKPLDELKNRFKGKSFDTSIVRRDSLPSILDLSVRSGCSDDVQLSLF